MTSTSVMPVRTHVMVEEGKGGKTGGPEDHRESVVEQGKEEFADKLKNTQNIKF